MKLSQVLTQMQATPDLRDHVTAWKVTEANAGSFVDFPPGVDPRLVEVLRQRGIERLFTHQREAIEAVHKGENVVVVTPTASGKTLCYNVPILNSLLANPESRAIYLFPTKALSQDQLDELHGLITALGVDIKTYTYDGDTPVNARKAIRAAGFTSARTSATALIASSACSEAVYGRQRSQLHHPPPGMSSGHRWKTSTSGWARKWASALRRTIAMPSSEEGQKL